MTQQLLLAVDGGGTKTQAVVADPEGHILGRGLGPSSNLQSVSLDQFGHALITAIEGALMPVLGPRARREGPGWLSAPLAAAVFGLAGVDGPEDEARVSRWARDQAIAASLLVVNDAELILGGGTPDGWGIALISGTGSICLGRSSQGRPGRVGGWGPLIGDEGSGYDLARSALRLATQTSDGRGNTPSILKEALRHFGVLDAEALMRRIHDPAMTPADVASFAAPILDLSGRGDAAAKTLVEEAAQALVLQVRTLAKRLSLRQPPLALGGGLLRGQLRRSILALLEGEIGPYTYVAEPVLGAVELARRLLRGKLAPLAPGSGGPRT